MSAKNSIEGWAKRNDTMSYLHITTRPQHSDWLILALIVILGGIGLVSVASVSSSAGQMLHHDPSYFTLRHILGLCSALILMLIVRALPYRYVIRAYPLLHLGALVATLATHSPWGVLIHGSARWLRIGLLVVQPSELLKVTTLVLLAGILHRRQYDLRSVHSLALYVSVAAVTILVFLSQPDFGQAMTVALSSILLLTLGQLPTGWTLASIGGLAIGGLSLAIISPYRLKRLLIFLNPWHDEHGQGFQVVQSLIALGTGGLTGLGLGQSRQKYGYLPMQHTDFIAAAIGEEWGLLGITTLCMVYILLTSICIYRARTCPGSRPYIVAAGALLINIQALFHLGVVTSCVPPKGIGLPFISYGSSSLLAFGLLLGTMLSALRHTNTGCSSLTNR